MPRKAVYDAEEVYDALKKLSFMENGGYLQYNHPIWKEANTLLPKMTPHYIWLYITKNRNGVSSRIHGLVNKKQNRKRKLNDISNWSVNDNHQGLKELKEKIHISIQEWNKLGLKSKTYNDNRIYEVFEPGWTDKIYSILWDKFRLPCPFTFKNPKINREYEENFLTIRGTCSECKTEIHIYSENEPTDKGLDLCVSTFDTTNIPHKQKRQLRGKNRAAVANALKGQSTYMWRRHFANERMHFKEQEPAHLYSEEVLRKAKQQNTDKELNLKPHANQVLALMTMKSNPKYSGSIREIGADKLYIMYWSPEQIYLYKSFLKSDPLGSICVDATGSLIRSASTMDSSKRVIFLYQAIASYNNKTLPLFQLVSEKHDANTLSYWIREWLRCGVNAPKQIVCDYSLALLNASSIAFNQMSLNNYIDDCFESITKNQPMINKRTILRIDIAHLIKFVTKWPCLSSHRHKDFYTRCVVLLVKCLTFEDFKQTLTLVMTVAYSKNYEKVDNNICYKYCKQLLHTMKTGIKLQDVPNDHLFADMSILQQEEEESFIKEKISKNCRPVENFLQKLQCKCRLKVEGKLENNYYNPDFAQRLSNFSKNFVLWSAVVPALFYGKELKVLDKITTASSAISEEYFKDIKKLILNNERNLKIDKFLSIHLNALSGTMNLIGAKEKPKNKTETIGTTNSSPLSDFSNEDYKVFDSNRNSSFLMNEDSRLNNNINQTPDRNSDLVLTIASCSSACDVNTNINYEPNIDEKDNKVFDSNIIKVKNRELDSDLIGANHNSACDLNIKDNYIKHSYIDEDQDFHENSVHEKKDRNSNMDTSVSHLCETHYEEPFSIKLSDLETPICCSTLKNDGCDNPLLVEKNTQQANLKTNSSNNSSNVPDNIHLNYVDEWKGVLIKKKKPGLYLQEIPDIENHHKLPKCARHLPLIVNGSSMEPVTTSQGVIKVINTCAIDSVFHAIRGGYVDKYDYNLYIEKSNSKVFEIVKLLSSKGTSKIMYKKRAELILTFKKVDNKILDAEINVGTVIDTIMIDEPSIVIDNRCNRCRILKDTKLATLAVDFSPIYTNGIKSLQESVDLYLNSHLKSCKKCKKCQKTNFPEIRCENHLFIDIEGLHWQYYREKQKIENMNYSKFSLEDIPEKLSICERNFSLVAVIEHVKFGNDGHYHTFVKRRTNVWEIHDGLNKSSLVRKLNTKELRENRKAHVLFYVKDNYGVQ